MPKAILAVIDDGATGYGDLLFVLKMIQNLRVEYEAAGKEVPPLYLITGGLGKKKISDLKGDVEFGVEVLTPDELKVRIESRDAAQRIEVGAIIEGPALHRLELITQVSKALGRTPAPIPLTTITEYGFKSRKDGREVDRTFDNISYERKITTGFDYADAARGILVSKSLAEPKAPAALVGDLDAKIREALIGSGTLEAYQAGTELYLQYSYDRLGLAITMRPSNGAYEFTKIHREFVKGSSKNQDVLMVGPREDLKIDALRSVKEKLISDGFTRIIFYNADTKKETIIHDAGASGKTYRVVYTAGMSHPSMMACTALSGPLMGATGDQSFGEAASAKQTGEASSAGKIISYECLAHKKGFIGQYDDAIILKSGSDPDVIETIALLRTPPSPKESDKHYARLGVLLRTPSLRARLFSANEAVVKNSTLVPLLASVVFTHKQEAVNRIAALLRAGKQQEALDDFLNPLTEDVNIFDKIGDKSIFEYAKENDPKGVFIRYFKENHDQLLLQVIRKRPQSEVIKLIGLMHLNLDSMIGATSLFDLTKAYYIKEVGEYLLRLYLVSSLRDSQNVALKFFNPDPGVFHDPEESYAITIFDLFEGKSILHHAVDANPSGEFVKHYIRNEADVLLFQAIVNKRESDAIKLIQARKLSFDYKIAGRPICHYASEYQCSDLIKALGASLASVPAAPTSDRAPSLSPASAPVPTLAGERAAKPAFPEKLGEESAGSGTAPRPR